MHVFDMCSINFIVKGLKDYIYFKLQFIYSHACLMCVV